MVLRQLVYKSIVSQQWNEIVHLDKTPSNNI